MAKKVYVSSPYQGLIEHRAAVKATLEKPFDVDCMEKYTAFSEPPLDKCLADVAECDYCVLVLAWRHGYRPKDGNPQNLSITELEYREAVRLKKPCLVFWVNDEYGWPPPKIDPNAFLPDIFTPDLSGGSLPKWEIALRCAGHGW